MGEGKLIAFVGGIGPQNAPNLDPGLPSHAEAPSATGSKGPSSFRTIGKSAVYSGHKIPDTRAERGIRSCGPRMDLASHPKQGE